MHESIIWRNEGREDFPASFPNSEKYQGRSQGDEREEVLKISKRVESVASPIYSHDGCENSATHADPQRILLPTFTARRMEEEDAPREETLSDYLQEYESQSWRFKKHLDFQGFFQLKEDRRSNNHNKP